MDGQRERMRTRCRNAGRQICLHTSAAAEPDLLLENSSGEHSQGCHGDEGGECESHVKAASAR